ncbi:MAG: MarR family winged helix-turn-helix transcriptional regulator [Acidimicrobiales bacterium]
MTGQQTENLLGALSLALFDRMQDAVGGAAGQADNGAVALSALSHFLRGPSIDTLGKVLGLTSSGTVRLVDRLAEAGLVRRDVGADGRVTTVVLTAKGRRAAARVTAARQGVLGDALQVLGEKERQQLGSLVGRVLAGLARPPGAVRWTCRLCDTRACGREEGRCPLATAVGYKPSG